MFFRNSFVSISSPCQGYQKSFTNYWWFCLLVLNASTERLLWLLKVFLLVGEEVWEDFDTCWNVLLLQMRTITWWTSNGTSTRSPAPSSSSSENSRSPCSLSKLSTSSWTPAVSVHSSSCFEHQHFSLIYSTHFIAFGQSLEVGLPVHNYQFVCERYWGLPDLTFEPSSDERNTCVHFSQKQKQTSIWYSWLRTHLNGATFHLHTISMEECSGVSDPKKLLITGRSSLFLNVKATFEKLLFIHPCVWILCPNKCPGSHTTFLIILV